MNLVRPMKPLAITPERVYLRAMNGAIQELRSGTTSIVDDMNVPGLDRALLDAAFRAYDDIGIRAYAGMTESAFSRRRHRSSTASGFRRRIST